MLSSVQKKAIYFSSQTFSKFYLQKALDTNVKESKTIFQ